MGWFWLHSYDLVMLVILVGVTLLGVVRGAVWQVASLASLILSAIVAVKFGGPLAPWFGKEEPWNHVLAMLILYLLTSLLIWIAFRFVSKVIDRLRLEQFDRQIGGLLGLAKAVLLCIVITFFAVTLSETARQSVLHSYSGYYISVLLHRTTPLLPLKIRIKLGEYIAEFDRRLPNHPPDKPGAGGREKGLGIRD